MVVINLYPFEQTISKPDVSLEESIEQIDIGGPAMIRSAAKNYRDVAVITSPASYEEVMAELIHNRGALSARLRAKLAATAYAHTSKYDSRIFAYLAREFGEKVDPQPTIAADSLALHLRKVSNLRYGENPHQRAGLFINSDRSEARGIASAELLNGKEMSFNNYVDADAAWQLICDFDAPACAIIKHTNPAGVGLAGTAEEAYRKALATDPTSAFGGIVAFNRTVDAAAARALIEIFTEVVVAPDYESTTLDVLRTKKNLRVLRAARGASELEFKQISGGMLIQTPDTHKLKREDLKVVSSRPPTDQEIDSLLFAWTVCKHTKSNAIVYARDGQTVGVGAGQMSRVDSVKIGAMRAQLPVSGSVLASDAFFPFRDGIDEAAKHGITAVIQPGGSVRDEEVIAAANEHGLAMVFTGIRHFKH
jgi:phosphoribosylaminoimidazolecarboxamide formyltransferase/IMP cyclohydrolase